MDNLRDRICVAGVSFPAQQQEDVMKTLLASLGAAAALAAAVSPAAAQTTGYVDGLNYRIDQAARQGRISWNEARNLHMMTHEAQPLAWRVQTGQARPWERARLERLVGQVNAALAGPTYGYGYGPRGYGQYGWQNGWGWRR
jgi:hypothetical protein